MTNNIKFNQKDLDFLNEDYSMNDVTLEDIKDICEEMIEDLDGTIDTEELEQLYFWEQVLESLNSVENIKLKDKDDKDCFMYLSELTDEVTSEEDYFDGYDREQDLWTYFDDTEIYKFELDSNNELVIRLNKTLRQLKKEVKNQYSQDN
jgi:hypothetical protein